ncbi:hypothetical protein Tco_0586276 [Tanacetum coccineum]
MMGSTTIRLGHNLVCDTKVIAEDNSSGKKGVAPMRNLLMLEVKQLGQKFHCNVPYLVLLLDENSSCIKELLNRSRPPTKSQLRNLMITYLKNMGGYKHSQLKSKSLEEIQAMYEGQKKKIDDFKLMDSNDAVKDYKQKERCKRKSFSVTRNRKRRCPKNEQECLKRKKNRNQERWNLKSWNFYENCGVHTLTIEDGIEIYMLVERKYPLIKEILERMMSLKLIAESASDSAYDLLRFIQKLQMQKMNSGRIKKDGILRAGISMRISLQLIVAYDLLNSFKIILMKLEAMMEKRRIFKCWFHHHITNGHQFTTSNKHQERASPEQTAPGKDFSNLLMGDSLPKTIWFSAHHASHDYAGASLDRKSTTGGCQFLGDSNEKKLIQMIKIHTDKNVADLLTKAFDTIYSDEAINEENVPTHSNDPLLSSEDRLKLKELRALCTNLQNRVLDLEHTKTTQALDIDSLKRRVKNLEKKKRSRTHRLRRLYKVGLSVRVISSEDEGLGEEDASKQGRKIHDIDADEDITLENVHDEDMFDTDVFNDKEAQTLAELKSARPKTKGVVMQEPSETTTKIPSKDKGKGIMVKEPLKMKKKDQDKVETDYELAQRLQAEEQEELTIEEKSKLFQQLLEKTRNHFAAKRAKERRNRPPTKAQQRSIMTTYLKNMTGWKPKDLKNKSFLLGSQI